MTLSKSDQRRVLLVDHDLRRQQLRAGALRNCEVEVDSASSLDDASRLWTKRSYDLVLLAAAENSEEAALVLIELRKSRPRQRIACLVGAPAYIRELGCERSPRQPLQTWHAPTVLIGTPQSPTSQWRVMVERVLAAG